MNLQYAWNDLKCTWNVFRRPGMYIKQHETTSKHLIRTPNLPQMTWNDLSRSETSLNVHQTTSNDCKQPQAYRERPQSHLKLTWNDLKRARMTCFVPLTYLNRSQASRMDIQRVKGYLQRAKMYLNDLKHTWIEVICPLNKVECTWNVRWRP
jgi:hypothetical protein